MKEYLILVTQLEHLQRQGLLSLQKLWFYIQPTMRTMEILASIGKGSFSFAHFARLNQMINSPTPLSRLGSSPATAAILVAP